MFTFLVGEINGFRTRLSARAQFAIGNRKKAGRVREINKMSPAGGNR